MNFYFNTEYKSFNELNLKIKYKSAKLKMDETHLMLLKVSVQKIQLSVRFPCSLTFQLKVGNISVIKIINLLIVKVLMSFLREHVPLNKH